MADKEKPQTEQKKARALWPYPFALLLIVIAASAAGYFLWLKPNMLALQSFAPDSGKAMAQVIRDDEQFHRDLQKLMAAGLPQHVIDLDMRLLYMRNQMRPVLFNAWEPGPNIDKLLDRIQDLKYDGIDPALYGVQEKRQALKDLKTRTDDLLQRSTLQLSAWDVLRLSLKLGNLSGMDPREIALGIHQIADDPADGVSFPDIVEYVEELESGLLDLSSEAVELDQQLVQCFERMAHSMGLYGPRLAEINALFRTDVPAALAAIEPNMPDYQGLREGLRYYYDLQSKVTLEPIKPRSRYTKLKLGSEGDLVRQLQIRLSMEDFYNGPLHGYFDQDLEDAVKDYQEHHLLTPDGVVHKATFEALNVPLEHRIAEIRLALSKLRETPCRWQDFYFRVNIPQFEVHVIKTGEVIRSHRVIVGNRLRKNHTPEFRDEIEFVEYNPFWNVPERIVEELVAKAGDDEDYWKKRGYRVREHNNGRMTITQSPGWGNALGRVKILFPNRHDVYLHDTPSKSLFNRTVRSYSHGCIRLQNALEMGRWLLEQDQHPEAENIDDILKSGRNTRLELQTKIPIHIEYVAVTVHEDGRIIFLTDIYGRDKEKIANILDQLESEN